MYLNKQNILIIRDRNRISNYIETQKDAFLEKEIVWNVPCDHINWIELQVVDRNREEEEVNSDHGTRGSMQSVGPSDHLKISFKGLPNLTL